MIDPPDIDEQFALLRRARDEDLGAGDVTTEATVPDGATAVGTLLAKQGGVLAGAVLLAPMVDVYREVMDGQLVVELDRRDGDTLAGGTVIGRLIGSARLLLAVERVALNFIQRLSGIATATRAFVDAVAGEKTRILDTRKTTPGWRTLEKYAVRCGGGDNHRVGLFDAILVKDNHIALAGAGGLGRLARSLRQRFPRMTIEIEVDTLDQLGELLAVGGAVDIILLDNMNIEQLQAAVRMRDVAVANCPDAAMPGQGRPLLEASGSVTLPTVKPIARTGVERISVGAITHSAGALDVSLEIHAS